MKSAIIPVTGLLCFLSIPAPSQVMLISGSVPAYDAGRYSSAGEHDPDNPNYLVGVVGGETYRGFVAFDVASLVTDELISSVTQQSQVYHVGGAWVRQPSYDRNPLDPPPPGYAPGALYAWQWVGDFERHSVVTTTTRSPLSDRTAEIIFSLPGVGTVADKVLRACAVGVPGEVILAGGTGLQSVFTELASGQELGSTTAGHGTISLTLNEPAFALIEAAAAAGEKFVVGLSIPDASEGEYLFGATGWPFGIQLNVNGLQTVDVSVANTVESVEISLGAFAIDAASGLPATGIFHTGTGFAAYSASPNMGVPFPPGPTEFGDLYFTSDPVNEPGFRAFLMNVPEPGETAATVAVLLAALAAARRLP
jgi:hypothetical protein